MADLPGPFPAKQPSLGWAPSDSLQEYVKRFATKSPFGQMGIALVDLTRAPRMGYAGWNDGRQIYVASLAKIGAMFAAFQLRQSVRAAAKQLSAADPADVFAAIVTAWVPTVKSRAKKRPADFTDSQKNW